MQVTQCQRQLQFEACSQKSNLLTVKLPIVTLFGGMEVTKSLKFNTDVQIYYKFIITQI